MSKKVPKNAKKNLEKQRGKNLPKTAKKVGKKRQIQNSQKGDIKWPQN